MRFNINLTELFDSPVKIKVIKYVIKPGFMMTGREVSRICGISASMAINILKEFEDVNLVSSRTAGKSVIWMPQPESYAYFVADRLFGDMTLYSPVEHLKRVLKDWSKTKNKFVERVVLFGSVSKGTENSSSDIDLFVLVNSRDHKEKTEKSLEEISINCVKLYGNVLNPYILTNKELQEKKDSQLIKNIEGGIKIL
jgi:predicted nucleotidyltransferase